MEGDCQKIDDRHEYPSFSKRERYANWRGYLAKPFLIGVTCSTIQPLGEKSRVRRLQRAENR
jgi:hypothetical protein